MPRSRADGTPARAASRRKLSDLFVQSSRRVAAPELVWDTKAPGLALSSRPSGYRAWLVVYRHQGRPRWLTLGNTRSIGLADARRLTARIMLDVAEGKDPAAERRSDRGSGTFADLAGQYVELHAKKHNKSWRQAAALVERHLIPRWGKLKANAVTRADVRAATARIEAPIVANQVLASASAVFSWAVRQEIITANPCSGVDRNPTAARERVLSDIELRILWPRLEHGLKLILLTGQRPGEVAAMARDHTPRAGGRCPASLRGTGRGPRTAATTGWRCRSLRLI